MKGTLLFFQRALTSLMLWGAAVTAAVSCLRPDLSDLTDGLGGLPSFSVRLSDGSTATTFTLYGAPGVICTFTPGDAASAKALCVLQRAREDGFGADASWVLIDDGSTDEAEAAEFIARLGITLPWSHQSTGGTADRFSKERPCILACDSCCNTKAEWKGGDEVPSVAELEKALKKLE